MEVEDEAPLVQDIKDIPLTQGKKRRRSNNPNFTPINTGIDISGYNGDNVKRSRTDCDGYIKILTNIYNLLLPQNDDQENIEQNIIKDLKKGVENDGQNDLVNQVASIEETNAILNAQLQENKIEIEDIQLKTKTATELNTEYRKIINNFVQIINVDIFSDLNSLNDDTKKGADIAVKNINSIINTALLKQIETLKAQQQQLAAQEAQFQEQGLAYKEAQAEQKKHLQ